MRKLTRGSPRLRLVLLAGLLVAVAAAAGIAWATIPGGGVYTGCYMKSGGTLRIIDASQQCKSSETRISWNQQGPQGIQGEQGPPGNGTEASALGQSDLYQTSATDDPLHLSVGVTTTLVTLHKPDNGTSGVWNKGIVTATVNIGTFGASRANVECQVPYGGSMFFTVDPDHIYSQTMSTVYNGNQPDLTLTCKVQDFFQGADIWVGWADLAIIPASYAERISH